jgi:hypothetical protein
MCAIRVNGHRKWLSLKLSAIIHCTSKSLRGCSFEGDIIFLVVAVLLYLVIVSVMARINLFNCSPSAEDLQIGDAILIHGCRTTSSHNHDFRVEAP